MRNALIATIALVALAAWPSSVFAGEPHKLALQVSDNDAEKMNAVLKGEEIEIEVVAFNAGLHMLRDDTSQVNPRLKSFAQSMPNVKFMACQNTLDGMTKREGKKPALVDNAVLVPAGVVRLIELNEKRWTIVRP